MAAAPQQFNPPQTCDDTSATTALAPDHAGESTGSGQAVEPNRATVPRGSQIDGQGGYLLARRRYQAGSIKLVGKKNKVSSLRWREDLVGPDGKIRRVRRETVLGSKRDFPTEKLARRRADVLLSRVNRNDYRPGKVVLFEDFVQRWREHVLVQQKPSSRVAANSHINHHLLGRFGKLRLDQIGQEDVQQFVTALGKNRTHHTVQNILGTLFSILKTARQWGYVVNEIRQSDLAISGSKPSRPGRFFTAEQVIAILDKANEPWRTMFTLQVMTGLRPGEVLGLSVDDLDFDSKQIFVRRSAWFSHLITPKTPNSIGAVPMPEQLEAILRVHLSGWVPNPKRLLFANRKGNPYSENNVVQRRLWPILDALKIPRCGMHAFRHAHATLSIASGASPKTVQEQLRHADPTTTMKMYVHGVASDQRRAANAVANQLLN